MSMDDTNYDEQKEDYTMRTWEAVFSQIAYCYEDRYGVEWWERDGIEYFTVYKGTFSSDGRFEYKGQYTDFDTKLWPKIKLFAKLFEKDGIVDLLYVEQK